MNFLIVGLIISVFFNIKLFSLLKNCDRDLNICRDRLLDLEESFVELHVKRKYNRPKKAKLINKNTKGNQVK